MKVPLITKMVSKALLLGWQKDARQHRCSNHELTLYRAYIP
jgi:hypothetical protein